MGDVSTLPSFRESRASIIRYYYATFHLRKSLPITLREILADYHRAPVPLDGVALPSGAVYRILCADDAGGPEKGVMFRMYSDYDYFPAYIGYRDLVEEVVAIAEWYHVEPMDVYDMDDTAWKWCLE